jgi:hypothetical protein
MDRKGLREKEERFMSQIALLISQPEPTCVSTTLKIYRINCGRKIAFSIEFKKLKDFPIFFAFRPLE